MTSLIACLSTGKGTWGHVAKLIKVQEWDSIFLITNDFGKENFTANEKCKFVLINPNESEEAIIALVVDALKGKILDTDVAVNLISGTGKEHMCVLSAVLRLGLGPRLVISNEKGIKEL